MKRPKGWKPAVALNPTDLKGDIEKKLTWFVNKMRPYSNHLFNTLLSKPVETQRKEEEINFVAEQVRNDMDHLRQCFKELNNHVGSGFLCSADTLTFLDLMVYIEIS
jgi:polysaccharide deacetylase 2 family uncharacterized protein YibQ